MSDSQDILSVIRTEVQGFHKLLGGSSCTSDLCAEFSEGISELAESAGRHSAKITSDQDLINFDGWVKICELAAQVKGCIVEKTFLSNGTVEKIPITLGFLFQASILDADVRMSTSLQELRKVADPDFTSACLNAKLEFLRASHTIFRDLMQVAQSQRGQLLRIHTWQLVWTPVGIELVSDLMRSISPRLSESWADLVSPFMGAVKACE